jgi:hypothetical protein
VPGWSAPFGLDPGWTSRRRSAPRPTWLECRTTRTTLGGSCVSQEFSKLGGERFVDETPQRFKPTSRDALVRLARVPHLVGGSVSSTKHTSAFQTTNAPCARASRKSSQFDWIAVSSTKHISARRWRVDRGSASAASSVRILRRRLIFQRKRGSSNGRIFTSVDTICVGNIVQLNVTRSRIVLDCRP